MRKLDILIVVVLVSIPHLHYINAETYEETETAQDKLDLAMQFIFRSFAHLDAALDLISEAKRTCHSRPKHRPLDCLDVQTKISKRSGVYQIWPEIDGVNSHHSVDVYCDMETDGGGWTVIQRRGKFEEQTDFYQDWETYKNGFGDIKKEFWLGNEKIFVITNQRNYSVRFDMVDKDKEYRYASYKFFSIGNESSEYVLDISKYSGNASATDDMQENNQQKFWTKDRKQEGRGTLMSCSDMYQSAFWFPPPCGLVNLNGVYQPGKKSENSIWWYRWKKKECLYSVEIKIRPNGV